MIRMQYHRLCRGFTCSRLAAIIRVNSDTIRRIERTDAAKTSIDHMYRISEVLGVTIDQLLRPCTPEETEAVNSMNIKCNSSQTVCPTNIAAIYMRRHRLTLAELARRMGLKGRESARQACTHPQPRKKHINALAAHEKISPQEFLKEYQEGER